MSLEVNVTHEHLPNKDWVLQKKKHTHEPHDWVVGAAGEQQTCWQLEPLAEHVSY
jgi:hypothetical protein